MAGDIIIAKALYLPTENGQSSTARVDITIPGDHGTIGGQSGWLSVSGPCTLMNPTERDRTFFKSYQDGRARVHPRIRVDGPGRCVITVQRSFFQTWARYAWEATPPPPDIGVVGGPTTATLERGGATGFAGVEVSNSGGATVPPQTVTASLPKDWGLLYGTPSHPGCQLTVWTIERGTTAYSGQLSPDKQTYTFDNVDLNIPTTDDLSAVYVEISADTTPENPLGPTNLTFTIGGQTSPSSLIQIISATFTFLPSDTTPRTLVAGGPVGYPGAHLLNTGSTEVTRQTVTMTLPTDAGLRFEREGHPTQQLMTGYIPPRPRTPAAAYDGTLSEDELTVTFTDVDLLLPRNGSESAIWTAISATADAPMGATAMTITIGDQTIHSLLTTVGGTVKI